MRVLTADELSAWMLLARCEFERKHDFIQAKIAFKEAQDRRRDLEERLWPRQDQLVT